MFGSSANSSVTRRAINENDAELRLREAMDAMSNLNLIFLGRNMGRKLRVRRTGL